MALANHSVLVAKSGVEVPIDDSEHRFGITGATLWARLLFFGTSPPPEQGQRASMEEALRTVLENLRANIENANAVVMSEPLPAVAAHETHIVQLLQNLVDNSLKHRGECPPQIRITAETHGSECTVRVSDNGKGIERQYFDEIFKPFKRLHGGEHSGSGIGLATCQKIVAGTEDGSGWNPLPGKARPSALRSLRSVKRCRRMRPA